MEKKNTWQILELVTPLPLAPTTVSKPSGERMPSEQEFFDSNPTAEDLKRYFQKKYGE